MTIFFSWFFLFHNRPFYHNNRCTSKRNSCPKEKKMKGKEYFFTATIEVAKKEKILTLVKQYANIAWQEEMKITGKSYLTLFLVFEKAISRDKFVRQLAMLYD